MASYRLRAVDPPLPPEESAAERLDAAFELFELAEDMIRARVLRERPGATEQEIDAAIDAWLRRRPGAENGDGEGRVRWHEHG